MIEIQLTQNKIAYVDDSMSFLADFKWQFDRKTGYGKRKFMIDGKRKSVYLHLYVYELHKGEKAPKGMVVDHENNNRLDCQTHNLRLATYSQNNVNKHSKGNKVGVKGIIKCGNKFQAKIQFKGIVYKSEKFETLDEACTWWNNKAKELDKDFFKGVK